MAKKTRRKMASRSAKTLKPAGKKKKTAKSKTAKQKSTNKKAAVAKTQRTGAAKPAKKSKPPVQAKPAPRKAARPPHKSFVQRVEGAFGAVADILTDAEQLHHRLEPGISNEPE
jgi:hypothetical protein